MSWCFCVFVEMSYTFHKSERLCSPKLIAQLFAKGNRSVSRFPFRFTWVWATLDEPVSIQVLFVAPKRFFPKANKRIALKRYLREWYRLRKDVLTSSIPEGKQLALAVSFQGPFTGKPQLLEQQFDIIMKQVANELSKNHTGPLHSVIKDI